MKKNPSLTCLLALTALTASLHTASAVLTINNLETYQNQIRFDAAPPTFNAANLTTLGSNDWAIFGFDGTSAPAILNRASGGTAISGPSTTINNTDVTAGNGGAAQHTYQRTNWNYTNGTSPGTASGSNSGGLGVVGDNTLAQQISFSIDVTGINQGYADVWYSTFQGNSVLTAFLGSELASASVLQGFDLVGLQHTRFNFTKIDPTDDTLFFSLGMDQRFSFNPQVTLYGVAFSAIPEPSTWALLAGGLAVLVVLRRRSVSLKS